METEADGYYKVYEEYSKTLRTWLVAYGIGAPVLFLSTTGLWLLLAKSGQGKCIVLMFLGGVALQIVLALVNKYVAWSNYSGADDEAYRATRMYAVGEYISQQFWVDILFDLGSVLLFAWSTYKVFAILTAVL